MSDGGMRVQWGRRDEEIKQILIMYVMYVGKFHVTREAWIQSHVYVRHELDLEARRGSILARKLQDRTSCNARSGSSGQDKSCAVPTRTKSSVGRRGSNSTYRSALTGVV